MRSLIIDCLLGPFVLLGQLLSWMLIPVGMLIFPLWIIIVYPVMILGDAGLHIYRFSRRKGTTVHR